MYVLRCVDGSLHVGVTRRSVEERISEYREGLTVGHTQARRPLVLLHSEHHGRPDDAGAAERRIKGWSRAKKIASMAGEFEALRAFAVRRGKKRKSGASLDTGLPGPAQDEGGGGA